MTTVLHVIDTGGPGGAETVFLNVAAGLNPDQFQPVCVVSRDGWLAESLRSRDIEPLVVPASGSVNIGYLRSLMSITRAHRIDVIVAHLYGSAVYCSLAGLSGRLPVVAVLHGQTDITAGERFAGLKRFLVRQGCDKLVFVSAGLKQELARAIRIPESRCEVIPNGVDLSKFSTTRDYTLRRELGLPSGTRLVGAIGNIRAPKGYDVFLRTARILKDRSPAYRFVIAGEGSGKLFESLLTLRSELGLEQHVTFLGLRADVNNILRNLDVYALSSTTEGFSIACIEAMASGVPVVATRSGGPEEIIEEGVSGLLVRPSDPQSLADAIDRLGHDRLLAARLAENGIARVRDKYTLASMLRSYERLLSGLA